ncbi:hypothetical protein EDC01DRAFT_246023 [Geopyxis carbonaria]|nr:hypothetical protein EDC01DRAFT_246023 [Geopyxis carbonaria]
MDANIQMSPTEKPLTPPYSAAHRLLVPPHNQLTIPQDHTVIPYTTVIPTERLKIYLTKVLDVSRLNSIDKHLRYASRPAPTRPLHLHKSLNHTIVVDERPDWHLVTWRTGITIKPLPRFLLDYEFFTTHLCTSPSLHANASGMLLSYADLIRTESDFAVAQDHRLLPRSLDWMAWAAFMADVQAGVEAGHTRINSRYRFGELRRTELLLVSWAHHGWRRRYYYIFSDFVTFGLANYGRLIAVFAIITILLGGLNLGLSTRGGKISWWVDMGWGLALGVVGVVYASIFGLVCLFVTYYVGNMWVNLRYDRTVRRGGWRRGGEDGGDEISWGYEPNSLVRRKTPMVV